VRRIGVPIEFFLALRFLRDGRAQTLLIIVGASIGVAVIVFLSALISGLEVRLISQTLGTQAHVVVRPEEEEARPLRAPDEGEVIVAMIERPPQRNRSIAGWPRRLREIERIAGISAVSPSVSGPAFAVRGMASRSVILLGVEPARFDRIYAVQRHMVRGRYLPSGTEVVIGIELADDLGVGVGDRLRIQPAEGRSETFSIGGIFDLGNREVNRRWALVSMRAAQILLDQVGGITNIDVRVDDVFDADRAALEITSRTGLPAESWMAANPQLNIALGSQRSSSWVIEFFVILAVALGIASVLVVSVVQRGRQIGILRAMGCSRARIQRVFLVQGTVVGLSGSILGSAMGGALALSFSSLFLNPDRTPMFAIVLGLDRFAMAAGVATLVGLLAAIAPARRASSLDPAEAIRNA